MRPVLIDTNAYASFKRKEANIIEIVQHAEWIVISHCDWRAVSWF